MYRNFTVVQYRENSILNTILIKKTEKISLSEKL